MSPVLVLSTVACALACSMPVDALEFRAVSDDAAILYDAPSSRSAKLFVVNRGYPVEVIVSVEGWVKVRDASGTLAWIESRRLTDKRTVVVKASVAQVRDKPEDDAPVSFQAQQNVVLEVLDVSGGWAQVRHRTAGVGYVKAQQVWGL